MTTTHAIDMDRLTADALHMLGTVIRFHDEWREQFHTYYETPEREALWGELSDSARVDEYDRGTGFDVVDEAIAATIHLVVRVSAWDGEPRADLGEQYLERHRAAALAAGCHRVEVLETIILAMCAMGESILGEQE